MKIERLNPSAAISLVRVVFADGSLCEFSDVGASLTRWIASDGTALVAGYRDYSRYLQGGMYFGATVGLTAGRIRGGKCTVKGKDYQFRSAAKNFLHGGDRGLSFFRFTLESLETDGESADLLYRADYRHEFMPGLVTVRIRYACRPGILRLDFAAETTEPALLNLTNHSYFNLDGDYAHDLSSHDLRVRADRVILVDDEVVGLDPVSVDGTVFDFRERKPILPAVLDPLLQNQTARGIDHLFLLDRSLPGPDLTLFSRNSGRKLDISTSYPGVTLYTTNYPLPVALADGSFPARHSALAIEPQFPANGINDPRFFDLILEPGIPYRHFIEYRISESREALRPSSGGNP